MVYVLWSLQLPTTSQHTDFMLSASFDGLSTAAQKLRQGRETEGSTTITHHAYCCLDALGYGEPGPNGVGDDAIMSAKTKGSINHGKSIERPR